MLPVYPELSEVQVARWNRLLLLLAELCSVPAALVVQVDTHEITVAASAETGETPYKVGEKEHLNTGLYCEHVINNRVQLCVPDATKDPLWDHNPDIKLGMISYLGLPLLWPDGNVFGTICVLDRKANAYSPKIKELLALFRGVVEDQLALTYEKARVDLTLEQLSASRGQLTDAVKIAVDQVVEKHRALEDKARGFSDVLDELAGSLVMISELPEHYLLQRELLKLVDELNGASTRLIGGQDDC
jgi:hypothetical protein